MKRLVYQSFAVIVAIGLGCLSATSAVAQPTITPTGSYLKAFFTSQSGAYIDSDPTGITFTPSAPPYAVGVGLPGVPPAPVAGPLPPNFGGPNQFNGVIHTSLFNDGLPPGFATDAQSDITDSISAVPVQVTDVSIAVPNWRLAQDPGATGYAFEQVIFGSQYNFTNNTTGLLGSLGGPPLFINGNVVSGIGNFAQFDGLMQYTWYDVNTAGVVTGMTSLGALDYSFFQAGGGSFALPLPGTGALLPIPANDGILAITGHMWIAGDPFEFTVSTVPEPSTLALLGMGGLALAALGIRRWRRR